MSDRSLSQKYRELAQKCRDEAEQPHRSEDRDLMLETAAEAEKLAREELRTPEK
jgi:hypothetical protein